MKVISIKDKYLVMEYCEGKMILIQEDGRKINLMGKESYFLMMVNITKEHMIWEK